MKSLEEQIVDIEKLDKLRRDARELQEQGLAALTAHCYLPRPRPSADPPNRSWETQAKRDAWRNPGDDVEKALMLLALPKHRRPANDRSNWGETHDKLVKDFSSFDWDDARRTKAGYKAEPSTSARDPADDDVDKEPALDDVPVFRCALVLQALTATEGLALSDAALICLYEIIRDLNEVVGPIWAGGAARASAEASNSAFVTSECARALLEVERSLMETANVAEVLGEAATRALKFKFKFDTWHSQESKFRTKALDVSLTALLPRVAVPLSTAVEIKIDDAPGLLEKIIDQLHTLPNVNTLFPDPPAASAATKSAHRDPPNTPPARMYDALKGRLSKVANAIARQALVEFRDAVKIEDAADLKARINDDPESVAKDLADRLRNGAQALHILLEPVESFVTSIINRELAAASPHLDVMVDAAELVFAAVTLGALTNWKDARIKSALEVLLPRLSSDGRLQSLRPFNEKVGGYRLNVATIEVTRRFADLLANLDIDPAPEFVERLIRPLIDTQVLGPKGKESGWTTDPPRRDPYRNGGSARSRSRHWDPSFTCSIRPLIARSCGTSRCANPQSSS